MTLYQLTLQLLKETNDAVARYQYMREHELEPDFFNEVKPYVDGFTKVLHDWEEVARSYVKTHAPKYFHEMQIMNIKDAMEQFIVQSFYQKTSKKRFMDSTQSVHYSLSKLKRYLEEGGLTDE